MAIFIATLKSVKTTKNVACKSCQNVATLINGGVGVVKYKSDFNNSDSLILVNRLQSNIFEKIATDIF